MVAHATVDAKRRTAETLLSALPMPTGEAGWARDVRAYARSRLLDAGAPIRRDEYWKYTDPEALVSPSTETTGDLAIGSNPLPFAAADPVVCQFIDGQYQGDAARDLTAPGLEAQTLSVALSRDISAARALFGHLELAGQEKVARPLAILNTATATDGLVFDVSEKMARPIHLRYERGGNSASPVRQLIRLGPGAELTVLESGSTGNSVTEIDVADGAVLNHIRLQTETRAAEASHLFIRQGASSQVKTFTLTADGALTRNEIVLEFTGDNASGHIGGAVMAQGASHIDNTVFVTHGSEHCESRQVFKNVLAGTSRSVFQGKIFVREGAQKTDGYQLSQAVLLNDGAEFSAKPELEIYADDVACSHGSTTGAIDPVALFYLRSRGVRRAEAEAMLVAAFVEEAILEIADPEIAEMVRTAVADWMAARG